ncbi:hypothetical protein FRC01_003294 [Tulasnella sp. 417]|nr:hypothetical protein FRC01_003294 [Tulasnella sp. 417]
MENQLPQCPSPDDYMLEDVDDDHLNETLSTKYINLPHFKIETLLEAYGSPWAPQEEVDALNAVEAIATNGLLGHLELLDSKDEAVDDTDLDERSTQGAGPSAKGANAKRRQKRAAEGNAVDAKPFNIKAEGQLLASLWLKQIKTSTVVEASSFSTQKDARRSEPGFIGIKDKGNCEPAANPTTVAAETSIPIDNTWMLGLLKKLLRAGYQYVPSDIKCSATYLLGSVNMPITDADGFVVGVIAGIPTGLCKYKCDINLAVDSLEMGLGNHADDGG